MVHVTTPNQPGIPDIAATRCGVQRQSMRTNVLIHRAGLSEVNKVTFANPAPDRVFGVPKHADPEGARDVTMCWKSHQANPNDVPGPDFRSMNKLAAIHGLTKASEQHGFRKAHPKSLKSGEAVKKPPPPLPSDLDPTFKYGMPGTYRSAEQIRNAGPTEPLFKPLMQNQYADTWVHMNAVRAAEFDRRSTYIPPRGTKATQGHKSGRVHSLSRSQVIKDYPFKVRTLIEGNHAAAMRTDTFKLTKFMNIPPRVSSHRPAVPQSPADVKKCQEETCSPPNVQGACPA